MTTKSKSRSVTQTSALTRVAPGATVAAPIELDNMLNGINSELTPLLELKAASPVSRVVSVGAISVVNPEFGFTKTLPPISNLLPAFAGGTVTFPSASGSSATPSVGSSITITITSGNFLKVGISVDTSGSIVLLAGTQGASAAAATVPALVPNTFSAGYVLLQNVAGTIQNIATSAIFQYDGTRGTEKISDLNDVTITSVLDGQTITYNGATSKYVNTHERWASETATITSNAITPTTTRPTQRITGTASTLNNLASPTADQVRVLINETGSDITISNDAGGTVANRFYTGSGADFTLKNQAAVLAVYDAALSRWVLLGGSGGSGGLSPVATSTNVTLAANNTMYEVSSTGGVTITLPTVPATGGVIGFLDAAETCSAVNFIRITPATGQSIDGYVANDSILLDYARSNIVLYAAPGATSWKAQYQLAAVSGSSSGGLSGLLASANVNPAVNNTMYECTSTGGFTITLPTVPSTGGSIGVMDAAGTCSATNFIRITPASGQSLDGLAANDSYLLDYSYANVVLYAAVGATSWKLKKQATTMVQGGQLPASNGVSAIAAGYVGENFLSTQPSVTNFPATNTYSDGAMVTLTPGVWAITALIDTVANGATISTTLVGISSTSGNSGTGLSDGINVINAPPPSGTSNGFATVPSYVVQISTTTPFYMKVRASYTAGIPQYRGRLTAIRIG